MVTSLVRLLLFADSQPYFAVRALFSPAWFSNFLASPLDQQQC